MKAIIFHGTLATPDRNWFPWLKRTLVGKGWDASVPQLPTPDQSPDKWLAALKDQNIMLDDIDVLIGHSTGANFILHLLQRNLANPKKAILVGTVIDKINHQEYDTLNAPFILPEYDWSIIKNKSVEIILLHGDNDPYVPLKQPQKVADNLDAPLHLIHDGGHLNAEAGYTEFHELLDYLS